MAYHYQGTNFIVSTTNYLEGYSVRNYLGVVAGEAIIGANIFRDLFAGIRDIIGGRSHSYEQALNEARVIAMDEIKSKAQKIGGNALIGVTIDYETIGGMLMVCVSGTAVTLTPASTKK
jgi:uncharacterized protein YbjQ (UPF0145 family)